MKKLGFLIVSIMLLQSLHAQNPHAKGFDLANSDSKAVAIADDVMKAMGGRKSWDKVRYLCWNFFGARKHIWDKKTGDVRIEGINDKSVAIFNINKETGTLLRNNELVTHPDSVKKYLTIAKGQWINDSYWLVMPFKLKDSGVTLKYMGEGKTQKEEDAHMLSLTFNGVGNTPQNKYHIWVTKKDNLVKQWAYFPTADLATPRFMLPWDSYQQMDKILLSGDRGERKLTDIKVLKKLDRRTMKDPRFF